MSISKVLRRGGAALLVASMLVAGGPALAEDPTPEHLSAAREAIAALKATDQFDVILPNAAEQLKASLIQATPDLQPQIESTVNDEALAMAPRRADLEKEAAAIYAKTFSEADLKAIATFYTSPAGKALLDNGALVTRELLKAAEIWTNGIQRDLATNVAEKLHAELGDRPKIGAAEGATDAGAANGGQAETPKN